MRRLSALVLVATVMGACATAQAGFTFLEHPIDPRQQTALAFCDRSHWLQPWRGYLDTWPVGRLRRALGINVNVPPARLSVIAQILRRAGFRHARIEFGWDRMSYEHPGELRDPGAVTRALRILDRNGLRPLLLLNANHLAPQPGGVGHVALALPALAGARSLQVTPETAAAIKPGFTGLRFGDVQNAVLFTSVSGTTVGLSRPLPAGLAAGQREVITWRYLPFGRPNTRAGAMQPRFQATLDGWLGYVRALTTTAREAIGRRFDVEVWNEMTFGANFLDARNYYDPLPGEFDGAGDAGNTILRATIAQLRADRSLRGIGITDGFAGQTPFPDPASAPAGLTAFSKHPYSGPRRVFGGLPQTSPCRPLDALGRPSGRRSGNDWTDAFTPSYVDYFPEYYLNAIQTEHLVRDVSPLTTDITGAAHGRRVRSPDGRTVGVWITETNMDPSLAGLSGGAARRMQAKSLLRTLVAFVSKGFAVIDFYAALGDTFGLVDAGYVPGANPGAAMDAAARFTAHLGHGRIRHRRSLTLEAIGDTGTHSQFSGDGTAAHPTLWDRDVTAVFPFQVSDREFVIPAYVMTRDVAQDLPAAPFRLVLGGLRAARVRASAYDPIQDRDVPVAIVARTARTVTVELALTDSVRLLRLREVRRGARRAGRR